MNLISSLMTDYGIAVINLPHINGSAAVRLFTVPATVGNLTQAIVTVTWQTKGAGTRTVVLTTLIANR